MAKIGNPGKARAMAVTALKAIGLMAVPAEDKEAWWSDFLKWVHIAIYLLLSKVSILLDKFPISLSVSKCFKFSVNVDLRMLMLLSNPDKLQGRYDKPRTLI